MNPNIGRLLAIDEGLNHQIVDTFATVVESDLSWTEKIWLIPRRRAADRLRPRPLPEPQRHRRLLRESRAETSSGPYGRAVSSRRTPPRPRSVPHLRGRRAADQGSRPPRQERRPAVTFDVTLVRPPFLKTVTRSDEHGFRMVSNVVRYHQGGTVLAGWRSMASARRCVLMIGSLSATTPGACVSTSALRARICGRRATSATERWPTRPFSSTGRR